MRKPKLVSKEIQTWTEKLATLKSDLGKAQTREAKAEKSRSKIVLRAKTGHKPSQEKLEQFTEDWIRATREKSDYETAIEQCQQRLEGFETELKASQLAAGKALLAEYGKKLETEYAPAIDKAVAEVIAGIQKVMEPYTELRKSLEDLGFPESNFDADVNKMIGAFIRASFYPYAKSYFEFHPHKHEWNRPLSETLTEKLLEFSADKAIRDKARDEAMNVASIVDLSDMREITQSEALIVEETRKRMREDAAQLKAQVVA